VGTGGKPSNVQRVRVRTTYVACAHGADTSAIEAAHEEMNRFSGQTSPWVHNVPFLIPLSFSPAAVSTLATIAIWYIKGQGGPFMFNASGSTKISYHTFGGRTRNSLRD